MKYVAAYLMLVLGGNDAPTAEDVKALLGSAEIEVDDARLTEFAADIVGKDVSEMLAKGLEKMTDMPMGGGGGGGGDAGGQCPDGKTLCRNRSAVSSAWSDGRRRSLPVSWLGLPLIIRRVSTTVCQISSI